MIKRAFVMWNNEKYVSAGLDQTTPASERSDRIREMLDDVRCKNRVVRRRLDGRRAGFADELSANRDPVPGII